MAVIVLRSVLWYDSICVETRGCTCTCENVHAVRFLLDCHMKAETTRRLEEAWTWVGYVGLNVKSLKYRGSSWVCFLVWEIICERGAMYWKSRVELVGAGS